MTEVEKIDQDLQTNPDDKISRRELLEKGRDAAVATFVAGVALNLNGAFEQLQALTSSTTDGKSDKVEIKENTISDVFVGGTPENAVTVVLRSGGFFGTSKAVDIILGSMTNADGSMAMGNTTFLTSVNGDVLTGSPADMAKLQSEKGQSNFEIKGIGVLITPELLTTASRGTPEFTTQIESAKKFFDENKIKYPSDGKFKILLTDFKGLTPDRISLEILDAQNQHITSWSLKAAAVEDTKASSISYSAKDRRLNVPAKPPLLDVKKNDQIETPVAQKMHKFALTDGKTLEMPEFATPQEAIDYISKNTLWRSGDWFNAQNTWLTTKDSLPLISKLKKIDGAKPVSGYVMPRSGKNFFLIDVDQTKDGTIIIFEDKDKNFSSVFIDVQETTFAAFIDRGAYFITTPTP